MNTSRAERGVRASAAGFSLLELIVTLAIISVIAGMVAPMFGASIGSIQYRNARNDLIAVLQFTQELAVRDGREYRVYIDKRENAYWVEALAEKDGPLKTFVPVTQSFGQRQVLPEYIDLTQIRARKDRGSKDVFVACYPNGASDEAEITVVDKRSRGRSSRIEVAGLLGKVSVTRERR